MGVATTYTPHRRRNGAHRRGLAHLLALIALVSLLPFAPGGATSVEAQTSPPPAPVRVVIGADGQPNPLTVAVVPDQVIEFDNADDVEQRIVATATPPAAPAFDSGPIPPGGRFVLTLRTPQTFDYSTGGADPGTGRIIVGFDGLTGAPTANARANVPTTQPPADTLSEFAPHPVYGYPTSRTDLLVLPTTSATVAQVNAALRSAGATVTGGYSLFGTFSVSVLDRSDFSPLLDAQRILRASPGIAAVAPVWASEFEQRTPRPPDLPDSNANWAVGNPSQLDQWGLRLGRVPAAWNALDTGRVNATNGVVDTVILDAGFASHPDVTYASLETSSFLAAAVDVNHGTHVGGIIGASYDDDSPNTAGRSRGVAGVNPLARMHGVIVRSIDIDVTIPSTGWFASGWFPTTVGSIHSHVASFENVLNEKRSDGRFPRLAVVNASIGAFTFQSREQIRLWANAVGSRGCGPGPGDDTTITSARCTPETLDAFRADMAAVASSYASRVLAVAKARDVVIIKAAGNSNRRMCEGSTSTSVAACADVGTGGVPIELDAQWNNEFIIARNLGASTVPALIDPPLVVVGSHDLAWNEAADSSPGPGVDIHAPGVGILSTVRSDNGTGPAALGVGGHWYDFYSGTSMATPHVSAAIGYLLALRPGLPSLAAGTVLATRRTQSSGLRTLDVHAAAQAWAGAVPFADQSDGSADGNERVALDLANRPLAPADRTGTDALDERLGPRRSNPDGRVDMRDLRAFRDAWLQTCFDGSSTDTAMCPQPNEIRLDGAVNAPQRDGNLDGCVNPVPPGSPAGTPPSCGWPGPPLTYQGGEARFNRFDLNGNGTLSLTATNGVRIAANGAGTTTETQMTDLDVLQAAMTGTGDLGGFSLSSLQGLAADELMISGDVHVRFDRMGPNGTPADPSAPVRVYAEVAGRPQLAQTVTPSQSPSAILSVPVSPTGSEVKVWAVQAGAPSLVVTVEDLQPGQDTMVVPVRARLSATTNPSTLVPGRTGTLDVEALTGPLVAGQRIDDNSIAIQLTGPGATGATVADPTKKLDRAGRVRTTLTAGAGTGTLTVEASYTAPSGEVVRSTTTATVVPAIRFDYALRVTSLSHTESGDTRWPDDGQIGPDCVDIADLRCIDYTASLRNAADEGYDLTRRGTIRLTPQGVRVTEQIEGGDAFYDIVYNWEDGDFDGAGQGEEAYRFGPRASERNRYVDEPLPATSFRVDPTSVEFLGFETLRRLGYVSDLTFLRRTPSSAPDPVVLGVNDVFFLDPKNVDATRVGPEGTPVRFTRNGTQWAPFHSCYTRREVLDAGQGYRLPNASPWIPGAINLGRDLVYNPGDVPMPVTTGTAVFRHQFAASVSTTDAAPEPLVLPDCPPATPPEAGFEVRDARGDLIGAPNTGIVREGEAVRFRSTSTDADGDLASFAWTFGDGRSSTVHSPTITGYADNGVRTVRLTATDAAGQTDTETRTVTVVNVPPRLDAPTRVVVQRGQAAQIAITIDDPGLNDRQNLRVSISGGGTSGQSFNRPAGTHTLTYPGVVSQAPITITVEDKDGDRVSRVLEVVLQDTPVAPPPQCVPGAAGCLDDPPLPPPAQCPTVQPMDHVERAFLGRITTARTIVGLPELPTSPELMAGAIAGLTATGDADQINAAVRTAAQNAGWAAGSTLSLLTFTLFDGVPAPAFSTAQLQALRDIDWQTVAIARRNGPGLVEIAVLFSDVADCDALPLALGSPPVLTATLPLTSMPEGSTVTPVFTVTDPEGGIVNVDIDWGDGEVGGDRHRYRQDGTFTISVVAVDEMQNRTTVTLPLTVTDVTPMVLIDAPQPVAGQRWWIHASPFDPGELDRPLTFTVRMNGAVIGQAVDVSQSQVFAVSAPAANASATVTVTGAAADGTPITSTPITFTSASAAAPPPANVVVTSVACPTPTALRSQAATFLTAANAYRVTEGLGTLVVDPALQAAAQAYAEDLANQDYFSHTGRDGSNQSQRAQAVGYPAVAAVGENLLRGATSPPVALRGWQMSPPHNFNLLRQNWAATGIGVTNSIRGPIWVQLFGSVSGCTTTATAPAPAPIVLDLPAGAFAEGAVLAEIGTPEVASAPAQLAPSQTTPPPVPVVAMVIEDATPAAGSPLRIVNRSTLGGVPVAADLVTPTGGTRRIEPGATATMTFLSARDISIVLRGPWTTPTLSTSTSVAVTGTAPAPTVTVAVPASRSVGSLVSVEVTLTGDGGQPLSGRAVRATIAGVAGADAESVTNDLGYAEIPLRLAVPTIGPWDIQVWALDEDGDAIGSPTVRRIEATGNRAPDAVTTGPWQVNVGDTLTLDATPSFDSDGTIATVLWDLDRDGIFGEAAGRTTQLSWPTVERLVCAGSCRIDQPYDIRVRVIDNEGGADDDSTTVTFRRDFGIFVGPREQAIPPGGSNAFVVSVATTSGFDELVTLSALDLPAGVTASFSPTAVRPGQQSSMTITLPARMDGIETFDLAVQGRSTSGATRVARPVVDVVFGLVPVCLGEIRGRVLDAETGLPLAGVSITSPSSATTDADGRFTLTGMRLGSENRPTWYTVRSTAEGRWPQQVSANVACGIPGEVELRMPTIQTVDVRFVPRTGEPDPARAGFWRPTANTPAGATLSSLPTHTRIGDLSEFLVRFPLGADNTPTSVYGWMQAPGHRGAWSDNLRIDRSMVGGPPQRLVVAMPPICTARLVGGRVVDPDGNPVAGLSVRTGSTTVATNDEGLFTVNTDVQAPSSVSLSVTTPVESPFASTSASFWLERCDENIEYVEIRLTRKPIPPPPPPEFDGFIVGTVTDIETGEPVAGARVSSSYWNSATTDADGRYRVVAPITGPRGTERQSGFWASRAGFWDSSYQLANVRSGDTITVDMAVLRQRTSDIEVVVRDLATGLPIDGAEVWNPVTGWRPVGPDGRAFLPDRPLSSGNQPRQEWVYARHPGYWDRQVLTEVRQGETAFVDLGLLRECEPATVRGRVLDAVTRDPIPGASVSGFGTSATTGADGRFTMTGIRMQSQNTPWQSNVSASKTGYLTQTQTLSVFCGASVRVLYGPAPAAPGAVEGVVTRADTGAPVANVFVGADWGASVRTDANGRYRLEGAPLGDDGLPANWQVTAQSTTETRLAPATANVRVPLATTVTANLVMNVLNPPNRFPVARLVAPDGPPGDESFVLDATGSSDPDGDAITFDWDLDADGAFDDARGATVTTSLPPGTSRRVAVRVTDDKRLTGVARATVLTQAAPETTTTTSTTTTTTEPPPTTTTSTTTTTTSSTTTTTTEPPPSTTTTTTTTSTTTTTTEPPPTTTTSTTTTTTTLPTIVNLAPVIELDTATATFEIGAAFERLGRVTDDGPGPLRATIDLGDGSPAELELVDPPPTDPAPTAELSRAFLVRTTGAVVGPRTITVTVCDAADLCSSATFMVEVVPTTTSTTTTTTTTTTEPPPTTTTTTTEPPPTTTTTTTEPPPTTTTTTTTEPPPTTSTTTTTPLPANQPPTIELDATTATVGLGSRVERVGRVTDDGPGPLSATIDLGGGMSEQPLDLTELAQLTAAGALDSSGKRPLAASFVARSQGLALGGHRVTVRVCDAADACASASFQVEVVTADGTAATVPAPVTPAAPVAPAAPVEPSAAPTQSPVVPAGGLPATGSDPIRLLSLALLGIAAGIVCMSLARRRRRPTA
jgi:uncharacterized protein YkwD